MNKLLLTVLLFLLSPWVMAQSCPGYTNYLATGSANFDPKFTIHIFGSATVKTEGDYVSVDVTTDDKLLKASNGWVISRIAVFLGPPGSTPPVDQSGITQPPLWTFYSEDISDERRRSYHVEVPSEAAGNPKCGDRFNVAVYVMYRAAGFNPLQVFMVGNTKFPFNILTDGWWQAMDRCCEASGCGTKETTMETYATEFGDGTTKDIGIATIKGVDGNLHVRVEGVPEPKPGRPNTTWRINAVRAYLSSDIPPVNSLGGPVTTAYTQVFRAPPIVSSFNELPTSAEFDIPLPAGTLVACQQVLNYAMLASMVLVDEAGADTGEDGRNAWAVGEVAMTDTGQGSTPYYQRYGGCCSSSTGCTTSSQQYKLQSKYATDPANQISWPISEDTQLCMSSWFKLVSANGGNPNYLPLAQQWITSQLNLAKGASSSPSADDAMDSAQQLLQNCKSLTTAQKVEAQSVTTTLGSYNKGQLGPTACPLP